MNIYFSDTFVTQLQKRYKKKPSLRQKVVKQTKLFQQDPYYPSLKTHKLKGKRSKQSSFWIEDNLRIVFIWSGPDVIFTDVLTHDEY